MVVVVERGWVVRLFFALVDIFGDADLDVVIG